MVFNFIQTRDKTTLWTKQNSMEAITIRNNQSTFHITTIEPLPEPPLGDKTVET